MRRHVWAAVVALALMLSLASSAPTRADAAISGCSTGESSKVVGGVVQYRGWVVCYGSPPKGKKYYRAKILYSVLGTGVGDLAPSYGGWKKFTSGSKSYGKWVSWPYRSNAEGRIVQVK